MKKTKSTTKTPTPEKITFFVPGVGAVEAVDLDDVRKQLNKEEDGDGNS